SPFAISLGRRASRELDHWAVVAQVLFDDAPRLVRLDAVIQLRARAGGGHEPDELLVFAGAHFAHEHVRAFFTLAEAGVEIERGFVRPEWRCRKHAHERSMHVRGVPLLAALGTAADEDLILLSQARSVYFR